MANERELAIRLLEMSQLKWFFPMEAVLKLEALAEVCGIDLQAGPAKPLPARHRLDILARIVRGLILGGPPELLAERFGQATKSDQQYLTQLLREGLAELRPRLVQAPETPLGFLPEDHSVWAGLLAGGWEPMPPWVSYPKQS